MELCDLLSQPVATAVTVPRRYDTTMPEHGLLLAGAVNESSFRSEQKEKQLTGGTVTMIHLHPRSRTSCVVSRDFEYTDKEYRKYPAYN